MPPCQRGELHVASSPCPEAELARTFKSDRSAYRVPREHRLSTAGAPRGDQVSQDAYIHSFCIVDQQRVGGIYRRVDTVVADGELRACRDENGTPVIIQRLFDQGERGRLARAVYAC